MNTDPITVMLERAMASPLRRRQSGTAAALQTRLLTLGWLVPIARPEIGRQPRLGVSVPGWMELTHRRAA